MARLEPALDRQHLQPGDRVCAAVSGGADSVAMLLLLEEANALPRHALGAGLSAVHIHHGLRGQEADADCEFVRDLCARLHVPLRVFHVDVSARIAASRQAGRPETLEEAARTLRLQCFRTLFAERAADLVLTAHTLDDQAETVLMKLLRGAWTEGLSGIHPVLAVNQGATEGVTEGATTGATEGATTGATAGKIVRPLLHVRRAGLREYLERRGQAWREDSSNRSEDHTRNRLRHTVLPVLREENPAIDEALAALSTLAREEEARWNTELGKLLPHVLLPGRPVRGGGRAVSTRATSAIGDAAVEIAVEIERLRAMDPALRRRVLRAAARNLNSHLTFADTERLLQLAGLASGASDPSPLRPRSGARLDLAGGLRAERSARELRLVRRK